MSPQRALALAVVDHGNVVRRHMDDPLGDHGEIGAAWETTLAAARLFGIEHDLTDAQVYAVVALATDCVATSRTDTIRTTERNA